MPKIVFISSLDNATASQNYDITFVYGVKSAPAQCHSGTSHNRVMVSWNDKTVTWYQEAQPAYQLNATSTYGWVAIG